MICQLIYASIASSSFKREDLSEILSAAQRNNKREGLTGILVYANSSFLQVLEGTPDAVYDRFSIISQDHRHEWVFKLREGMVKTRDFPNWSMGLHECTHGDPVFETMTEIQSADDILARTEQCSDALLSSIDQFAKLHFGKAA